jgi:hypothetical protein
MKSIVYRLLARNAIVLIAFTLSGIILPSLPSQFIGPVSIVITAAALIAIIWANVILRTKATWLFAVITIPLIALLLMATSSTVKKSVTEYRYRLAGIKMETGCNVAQAMLAEMATLEHPDSPEAKMKLEFFRRDEKLRGHQGNHPVFTNTTQAIKDFRELQH